MASENIPGRAAPEANRPSRFVLPPDALLLVATLGLLWFLLGRQLSHEWSANEQYSYGWFVPFLAAFLFWLRWEEWRTGERAEDQSRGPSDGRHGGRPSSGAGLRASLLPAGILLLLLFPIRLFEVANPDWRPLSWAHALVVVGLTLLLIGHRGGRAAARHFAFPVCFILVAVPWLTPIEAPLVHGLMRLVAAMATETLTLFGIPAQLEGSLIRVATGVVGVNEACSGVRSLQTSLMIGLLLGELKRLTTIRRIGLVAGALAIALLANFVRAFFLVWIAATRNLSAVERWHDLAGYAIVGAVFFGTIALAAALTKGRSPKEEAGRTGNGSQRTEDFPVTSPRRLNRRFSVSVFSVSAFLYLFLVEAGVSGWYRWHERGFIATKSWTVRWPEQAPGFRELPIAGNIRSTLRYDQGREAMWPIELMPNEQKTPASCTMFFFRWEAGSASLLRARAHRPDICLPNTGWRLTADAGVRTYPVAAGLELPFRHFRFVRESVAGRRIFAEAFFCQREDRVPPARPDRSDATSGRTGNWMRADRVRVVAQGLRNQGQQVLEMVLLTSEEIGQEKAETVLARIAREAVVLKR